MTAGFLDASALVTYPAGRTFHKFTAWESDALGQPCRGVGGGSKGEASRTELSKTTARPMGRKGEPQVDVRPSLGYQEGKRCKIRIAADDDKREGLMILTSPDSHGRDGHVGALFLPNPHAVRRA